MLTQADLRSDPILIRKIKRMQQAEAVQAEESSGDEEVVRPKDQKVPNGSNSRVQILSTQQPPQSSIVEDLGDPSDDESDVQQPPMSSIVEDLGDPSDSE